MMIESAEANGRWLLRAMAAPTMWPLPHAGNHVNPPALLGGEIEHRDRYLTPEEQAANSPYRVRSGGSGIERAKYHSIASASLLALLPLHRFW